MSTPAISIAFFDTEHELHGSTRTGATLLFDGSSSNVLAEGPRVESAGGGWRAELEGAFSLALDPLTAPLRLPGVAAHVCRVSGRVGEQQVDCLGTVSETHTPPEWEQLDVLRSISALFDAEHAFLALGRRPRGAPGHDEDQVVGWLVAGGEPLAVEDARISTVYDAGGRQRSAGLELWMPGEDIPRRGSGSVVAGSSLSLEGLAVHAAVFRWRMEDREGVGAYELWVRSDPAAA